MIAKVLVFRNGMAMVFDENGHQMPEYQGTWDEKRELILRDKPECVQVQHGVIWPRYPKVDVSGNVIERDD